jgi:phospholipid/cholesterol/gamma-HCH transport system substrate-binding protein
VPLHEGTRAAIRAPAQAGVANRLVDLSPGSSGARSLGDGAVLGTDQTSGIVNIDALIDSFGPKARANMRALIARGAQIYAGSGAQSFNRMLGRLDPALAELNRTYGELASDGTALQTLVRTADQATAAIASRRHDLSAAMVNSARALGALADERAALADSLVRAPAVLVQARGTLAAAGRAVTSLRPALRDFVPTAAPLREYLVRWNQFLPRARPVVGDLLTQLPALRRSLAGLRPLERPAVGGLHDTGTAMADLHHFFEGLRFYGSDLVIGALGGVGGQALGEYDALGHYGKLNFVQNAQTVAGGHLAPLLSAQPIAPGLLGMRTGLTRRCPGGNVPPAPDGSSPWDLGAKFCTASQDMSASVNEP